MTEKKKDPNKLVLYVNDPTGRTRIFTARLPDELIDGGPFSAQWDALAPKPILLVAGEPRPDIPLHDRFAVAKERTQWSI